MLDLHVDPGVDPARQLVGHQPRRPQVGERVRQHVPDRLELHDRLAELHALLRERGGFVDQPVHRTAAAGGDHQSLVAEPLVRERHAVPFGADQVRGRDPHVLERDDRMGVGVGVRIARLAEEADAGRVLVDEEQGVLALVIAAHELRLEEDPIGRVVRGHVHLRAVQDVVVAVATRGRLDRVDVGAGALLGDRVALVALAAHGRHDPALDLFGRADGRCPRRRRVDAPAQGVGHPSGLFGDQDLLEHREPAAAELLRHVHRGQAELLGFGAMTFTDVVGDPSLVLFRVDLPRDQLVHEAAGALLDLAVFLRPTGRRHGR